MHKKIRADNALKILYELDQGMVYSDYALIPFDVNELEVYVGAGKEKIGDYEELKEWWNNEK